jgi:hypothetical protein
VAGRLSIAVFVASLALAPVSASAMSAGGGKLSPRLAELVRPSVRSAPPAVQAAELGLARQGPGSLLRQGNRILVYVRFERGAVSGAGALRTAGAEVLDTSRRYQTATVAAKPADLTAIAALPNVAAVREVHAPVTAAACPVGDVVSEGVQQLNAGAGAGEAGGEFSVDGSGVTVGILSDSFDLATDAADGSGPIETHALEDEESGDLPGPESPCANKGPVDVLEEESPEFEAEAADEGRGMVQIVHDLAPEAQISFASAFNGEQSFASNIEALSKAGADVIADDVFYFEEPFFQDGPVAVAVGQAVKSGSAFFSAAGNDNLTDPEGHEIASWETSAFRDAGSCPAEVQGLSGFNGTHCLDFDPGAGVDKAFGVKVEPQEVLTVDLQWDEPWNGVATDLDAFLLDASGHLLEAEFQDNIEQSQQPTEILQWINTSASTRTVQLVVNRFAGTDPGPRLKFGLLENGSGVAATEYPRSAGEDVVGPTIFGHSGSASAISVGAIRFNSSSAPEGYSSRGPVRHDFGPVKGTKAAAPISPEILSKPDVVATDCGLTTFFARFVAGQGWRFCGTSAAAPHAAGVAALMIDQDSTATPAEIQSALQSSATGVGAFGPCAIGAGLVEAAGAIEDLLSPPSFTPDECLPPEGEVPVEEARAPGDWGSENPSPPSPPPSTEATQVTSEGEPRNAPLTFFRQKPPRLVRTRTPTARVVFRFGSDQAGVSFACRLDGGLFRRCPQRLVRRFPIGLHTVRVFARDAAGNADRSPAAYRFRVKQIR